MQPFDSTTGTLFEPCKFIESGMDFAIWQPRGADVEVSSRRPRLIVFNVRYKFLNQRDIDDFEQSFVEPDLIEYCKVAGVQSAFDVIIVWLCRGGDEDLSCRKLRMQYIVEIERSTLFTTISFTK